MSIAEWDQELSTVAREIEQVRETHSRVRLTGNKDLLVRKVAIIQTQIHLDRNFERMRKLTAREFLLLPKERALLHWGGLFLEAAEKLFKVKTKAMTRTLWLRLIKARLDGTDEHDDVDADDMVSLAVRRASLTRTERYLGDALSRLQSKRKALVKRYEQLGIVEANREASGSMGARLGETVEDALTGPTMRTLQAFMRHAAAPISAAAENHRFGEAQRRYAGKTAGLLGLCRNMVVARLKEPAARPPARALDKFQAAMHQLNELENETRRSYAQILSARPEIARPILMQKTPEPVKTDPEG